MYAIDVRGFGSWMRDGGHDQVDFNGCLNDVRTALTSIRAANPGLPIFLLGESMGGAIALRAASMYPNLINGLISSVPSGDRFKQKKTDLKVALDFLKGPNKQFDVGKSVVDQATTNPQLRRDWQDNPLDRMNLSPKELIQFQSFMNDNHDSAKKIVATTVLMVQGTKDKLVKPEGTWELFNEIASGQKTFLAIPSEHLIYEDQQDKEHINDTRINRLTAAWILMQVDNIPPAPDDTIQTTVVPSKTFASITQGTPTVIAFYASWAEQCKEVKPLFRRLENVHGTNLKLIQVNIDDSTSKQLVKDFNVGPIPTFIFLTGDGTVVKTSIGMSNFIDFAKNVSSILPAASE